MPSRNWAAAYEVEMDQHTQLLTHTRKHAPHDAVLHEGGQVHPVIKMDVDTVDLCSDWHRLMHRFINTKADEECKSYVQ